MSFHKDVCDQNVWKNKYEMVSLNLEHHLNNDLKLIKNWLAIDKNLDGILTNHYAYNGDKV